MAESPPLKPPTGADRATLVPKPDEAAPTQLEQSIANADEMIGYAARYGVNIPTEALQTITAAKEAYKNGSLGAAEEAKFYTAFNDISKAIAPVTPASLDACLNERATTYKAWPWSKPISLSYAKAAVRRYHRTAFIALIVLLATQVYWVIGATLVSSIPQLNPRQGQISRENDRASAKPLPSIGPLQSSPTPTDAEAQSNQPETATPSPYTSPLQSSPATTDAEAQSNEPETANDGNGIENGAPRHSSIASRGLERSVAMATGLVGQDYSRARNGYGQFAVEGWDQCAVRSHCFADLRFATALRLGRRDGLRHAKFDLLDKRPHVQTGARSRV